MKVRIGALEIETSTMEELDGLVKRYGGSASPATDTSTQSGNGAAVAGGRVSDAVVLRRLVEVGLNGMPTKELGTILGRGGKATMGAAQEWAERIGLVQSDAQEAIERCRVGTQRGARIIPNLQDVAKALLDHMQK